MKRYFVILVLVSISLLLYAQSIADVRVGQDIRYRGNAVTSSASANWVFWEESQGSGYQISGQKYDALGNASFSFPFTVPTGTGSVRLVETVASSDGGIVLLLLQEPELGQVIIKGQKLNSLGQAQWTDSGVQVGETNDFKHPSAKLCANNQGGAFLLYRGSYSSDGHSLIGHNLDADGNDIWTAEPTIPASNWYGIDQLLLTDAGELIINIKTSHGNRFRKVNDSGTIIGSDPIFGANAVIPDFAKMQKGIGGNILIYSTDIDSGSPMLMQVMDADGDLLFSSLKELPLGFTDASGDDIKIAACADGGFILAYLAAFEQWGFRRELRAQRLNSELETMWGTANPLVLSDMAYMTDLDMAVDASEYTWLSVAAGTTGQDDMQVEVVRLDSYGAVSWPSKTASIIGQHKLLPRILLLTDKAMLFWGDNNSDQISVLRQVYSATGSPLLQTNGAQIRSLLSGVPQVYDVYGLGDKTICLMHDDRGRRRQIYYQILDSSLNQYMQENGQLLIPGEGRELRILGAKASPQNTLFVIYSKLNADMSQELYLQEIDGAGNRLYPASGILLATSETSFHTAAIGFEDDSAYLYWTYFRQGDISFLRSIKAQKIVAAETQWAAGGLDPYDYLDQDVSELEAHDRYLIFSATNANYSGNFVKALYLDPSGSAAANWPAEGLNVIDPGAGTRWDMLKKSGLIGGDLYSFVVCPNSEDGTVSLKAQKLNVLGEKLWGDAGLEICETDMGFPLLSKLLLGDEISFLYCKDGSGILLQRLDLDGNFCFAEGGVLMPGTTLPGNSDCFYGKRRLEQYANGTYSYFWVDDSGYDERYLKHVYVNPGGSLQETQLVYEADFDMLHTAMCDNNSILYWTQRSSDIFSWDSKDLISVSATALAEPVSNQDITAESVPMVILSQNYPNPFTGSTRISYKLREPGPVKIRIFNIKGQLLRELDAEQKAAGEYSWDWDGRDAHNQRCAAGIYLYKINAAARSITKKMVLLK